MDITVRSLTCHTATGTHMPCGITRCHLPLDRADTPASVSLKNKKSEIKILVFCQKKTCQNNTKITHTHIRLTALCPGLPGWAGTSKAKPSWISLKQETVSGSGISWAIYKSAPRSRQITTPAPHHLVVLQAGCPSCRPTNSVKALKV